MGSRRTHDDRDQRLREAGVTTAQLARLNSPIGLDLGAHTPEETAISITAEIIAHTHRPAPVPRHRTHSPLRPRESGARKGSTNRSVTCCPGPGEHARSLVIDRLAPENTGSTGRSSEPPWARRPRRPSNSMTDAVTDPLPAFRP
ncbi:XdhC family protein [Streptomyces canus]|uniref:XdhC family protein n=1 Tax=Streptomyces canus TaxID=58343 RepID=UPI00386B9B90